jgi:hypothetical protein
MKRVGLTCAGALIALAVAVPAMAGFGPKEFDNDFEGRVEADPTTYFGFDVKRKKGDRKVARVTALLHYACSNGDGGGASARVKGKLPVEDDRFAGTLRRTADFVTRDLAARGGNPGHIKYRVRGKFTSKRKAKGTVDAEIRFRATKMRGGELVRCYTGEVDWKARRGADVEPVVIMPRSGR